MTGFAQKPYLCTATQTPKTADMQILLADAKLMNGRCTVQPQSVPMFDATAQAIAADLARMDAGELGDRLKCSPKLAAENWLCYQNFLLAERRPAIMAYSGQAYKHLRAATLSPSALDYAQEHLRITCYLYGLLRPLDGIVPYRIEPTISLPATNDVPLFHFWRDKLTDLLIRRTLADDGVLVHLSTGEYEHLFDWRRLCRELRVVQPMFMVDSGGELAVQAVWAKACRGAMTHWLLEQQPTSVEALHEFGYEGFAWRPQLGEPAIPYFVREG